MTADPRWYEGFFETDEWLLLATSSDPERIERKVSFIKGGVLEQRSPRLVAVAQRRS